MPATGAPGARIVVVDDDLEFTRLVALRLRNAGYDVRAFDDGLKALEHIQATVPDLVLADIRMPGLDGFGLVVSLRSAPRTALIPVVFVTAIRDPRAQRRGMRLGADDFLVKPVAQRDLQDVVRTRIERSDALRRAAARAASAADPAAWNGARPEGVPGERTDLNSLQALARSGGYKLLRKLGHGGMSHVYLAREMATSREAVLKIVRFVERGNDELVQRFVREHAMLERVASPHLAALRSHGITDEFAYLALEYVDGMNLRERMATPVSPCEALGLMAAIAAAVADLHAQGVVHCDLKPENIMLRAGGAVVLIDLGIAVEAGSKVWAGGEKSIVGTPAYMSPERARGEVARCAADVYSLGILFHELLAGSKPFSETGVTRQLRQHASMPPALLPASSAAFQPLLDRMLAKAPEVRFADAGELLLALQDIAPSATPEASSC